MHADPVAPLDERRGSKGSLKAALGQLNFGASGSNAENCCAAIVFDD
jgi:hypothetical protein